MKKIQFQCCFCGEGIGKSAENLSPLDPCAVVLVANWQQPSSKQVEQQFFSHLSCFKSRMWHNVPVDVEELAADLESEKTGDS
jgi:hypothetical protein